MLSWPFSNQRGLDTPDTPQPHQQNVFTVSFSRAFTFTSVMSVIILWYSSQNKTAMDLECGGNACAFVRQ